MLDLVRSAEHVVNLGEVVGARSQVIDIAFRSVVLLEVGLLTKVAEL